MAVPYGQYDPTPHIGQKPAGAKIAVPAQVGQPSYMEDRYTVIDKEVYGGAHRVQYKSLLTVNRYDGIFNSRRVINMLCSVQFNDDGTEDGTLYMLKRNLGHTLTDWEPIGQAAPVTLNNPRTVQNLPQRDALQPLEVDNFVNVGDARTASEMPTTVNGVTATVVTGQNTIVFNVDFPVVIGSNYLIGTNPFEYRILNYVPATRTATFAGTSPQSGNGLAVKHIGTPAYGASYVYAGNSQWLRVYAYGNDPNSHLQNTDYSLRSSGGVLINADQIIFLLNNAIMKSAINDANVLGAAGELYSSQKIVALLNNYIKKPTNNRPDYFLAEDGTWKQVQAGTNAIDITEIDGGNATTVYRP